MRNSAAYYLGQKDIRPVVTLDAFQDYGILLCGGECSAADVDIVKKHFPEKLVGAYLLTAQLPPNTVTYPGQMARYVSSGSPVRYGDASNPFPLYEVGMLTDQTVAWTVDRAKLRLGDADILILDNWGPLRRNWQPGICFDGTGVANSLEAVTANWREYTVKTLAALHAAVPDVMLIPNVGYSVNETVYKRLEDRELMHAFCESINGVGVEGRALPPAQWGGNFVGPRCSILFTEDAASYGWAMSEMLAPAAVTPAKRIF